MAPRAFPVGFSTRKVEATLTGEADQPLVTVLVPARNAQRTIALALRSIIVQTYAHWELLVLDDGSSDATVAIVHGLADPRVRVLGDGAWLGLAARLNQGIDAARGTLLARLDADDVAFPERLAQQVQFLQAHPEVDLVGASAVVFGDDGQAYGRFPAPVTHGEICRRPWSGFYLPHPTWMGRIEWFRRFRYRPEQDRAAQDQDLLLRSFRVSTFANLPQTLIGYRQHELSWRKFARGRVQWVRAALREARLRRNWGAMITVPTVQLAKAALETAAIASGLGRRLLRHRARPLPAQEQERWEQLWRSLNE
ncbi:Glycosyl transferase, family 2 [Burkholderiales bacterium]|nr:Glycosyl transferase, family 2 [Burkholderiales bacterium]